MIRAALAYITGLRSTSRDPVPAGDSAATASRAAATANASAKRASRPTLPSAFSHAERCLRHSAPGGALVRPCLRSSPMGPLRDLSGLPKPPASPSCSRNNVAARDGSHTTVVASKPDPAVVAYAPPSASSSVAHRARSRRGHLDDQNSREDGITHA